MTAKPVPKPRGCPAIRGIQPDATPEQAAQARFFAVRPPGPGQHLPPAREAAKNTQTVH